VINECIANSTILTGTVPAKGVWFYARWNAWKAQAQDWREADLAYIGPEATFVPVCGVRKILI